MPSIALRVFGMVMAMSLVLFQMPQNVMFVSAQECPLPADFTVDFADTSIADVVADCPADPTSFDCLQCGCSIASILVSKAVADGYLDPDNLDEDAVQDYLGCAVQLLGQLEAVGLTVLTLLPLLSCEGLTDEAPICIRETLLGAEPEMEPETDDE